MQSSQSSRDKRLTLVATILGSSIAILDSSVVSVALPSIQRSLGGGLAGQQWVSNAYLLTLGSLILLGGSLGDIFGERLPLPSGWAALAWPRCCVRSRLRSGCWWRFARSRA
jgi:MFS family permease